MIAETHAIRRTRLVVLALAVSAAALAVAAPGLCAIRSAATPKSASAPPSAADAALATTAGMIESELTQLADGRTTLKSALGGVAACTVSPAAASRQLADVIANRTGISGQLASLPAPTAEAARVKTLLQNALGHSLAADRHYRDWVVSLQSRPRCSTTPNAHLTAAQHEDSLATTAKQMLVAAFNPLARRFHLLTWTAPEI